MEIRTVMLNETRLYETHIFYIVWHLWDFASQAKICISLRADWYGTRWDARENGNAVSDGRCNLSRRNGRILLFYISGTLLAKLQYNILAKAQIGMGRNETLKNRIAQRVARWNDTTWNERILLFDIPETLLVTVKIIQAYELAHSNKLI